MSGPPPPYNPAPGQFYQPGPGAAPPGQQYNQFQGPVQGQPGWNQGAPYQPQTYQQQPYSQQPYTGQPQPQTIIVHEHEHRREGMSDEQCCCIALLGACCLACCLAD